MGKKEIAFKRVGTLNLRIAAAKETLRKVRQQGHEYVELRPVSEKSSIFFCTLCLTQCFSEPVLYDHLQGNLHRKRYAAAKITLLLPNPWPFSDGVLFFNNSREKDLISFSLVSGCGRNRVSVFKDINFGANGHGDEVTSQYRDTSREDYTELTSGLNSNGRDACNVEKANFHDSNNSYSSIGNTVKFVNGSEKVRKCKGVQEYLTIPQVLLNEELSDVELKIIGFGHISSKICEDSEGSSKFSRIWCAWLGDWSSDVCDELSASQKCDFAIVNFSYTYGLGRKGTMDDENRPPSPGSFFEMDESGRPTKKRKKSFSDPDDSFVAFREQYGSSCEHSQNVNCCSPDSSHSKPSRRMSSRVFRQGLRKHNRSIAERNCDICRQPMLPEKDVATLLNLKTRKLACSSRNTNGAFHLFHVSCLIHWVLLLEFELWTKRETNVRGTRGRKGKASMKNYHISSIFCPECQGTGAHIEDLALEKPFVPLSETFLYKLNAIKAHKSWMKSPEDLKKCSTGLCFPSESTVKLQGKAMPAKLLLFYRADE